MHFYAGLELIVDGKPVRLIMHDSELIKEDSEYWWVASWVKETNQLRYDLVELGKNIDYMKPGPDDPMAFYRAWL